jgi:predicted nucleic acid-binding protein
VVVLDTDVVIDYMRADPAAVAFIEAMVQGPEPLAVAAITVMQLHEGIARSRLPAREAALVASALAGFGTLAFDEPAAVEAGRILGVLAGRGGPVGVTDVMVGATALRHGQPVATRNRKHFERMPGVRLVAYPRAGAARDL